MTRTSWRAPWAPMIAAMMAVLVPTLMLVTASPALADAMPPMTGKPHLAMRLVAESEHPRAGSTVTIAIATTPEAGWHGYWQNPGDAGFAGKYDWTLPRGATAAALRWPVPTTLLIAGLMNHVYEAPYALLSDVTVPAGLAAGTALPIALEADYLVCTPTLCVPEKQTLHLTLTVGDGAPGPDVAAFAGWRRAIPRPLDAAASYAVRDGALTLAIPYPAGAALSEAHFYPITTGAIDYAAPQTVSRDGDRLVIASKAAVGGKGEAAIDGVLRIGAGQGLAIHAAPGAVAAATPPDSWWWTALVAFAGAVLGGLILNIMPCVFPILSLKALSLARGGESETEARREALAYTAGVVLVCVGLGAAILALRATGSAVGWAFQLQDPRAIVVLLLLSVAIALNLAGLFEVPMPRFAGEGGRAGAFATGALAAFVATPCTGPFMGAALGAALVLPTAAALAVFAGLGIGLALPFLLIGYVPALRRRLPKPGGWMETFRRILSVPMWLTAIALAWVLGRQAGVGGMTAALVAALAAALLLWLGGLRQRRGLAFGWVYAVMLVAVAALAGGSISRTASRPAEQTAGAEPFSETRLAALRAAKRPVFAYFTADWCLTCKVNERSSIDTDRVRTAFAAHRVAVLVGDWTDGDARLGAFIQEHNRAGVPLYLYYAPGAAEPQVLPQVLTPSMLEALAS